MAGPVRRLAHGIVLSVKVRPGAERDAFGGRRRRCGRCRLADGQGQSGAGGRSCQCGRRGPACPAPRASRSAISLRQGVSAPWKRFEIAGDPDRLGQAAERLGEPVNQASGRRADGDDHRWQGGCGGAACERGAGCGRLAQARHHPSARPRSCGRGPGKPRLYRHQVAHGRGRRHRRAGFTCSRTTWPRPSFWH